MAYILLRNIRVVENSSVRRWYTCGCKEACSSFRHSEHSQQGFESLDKRSRSSCRKVTRNQSLKLIPELPSLAGLPTINLRPGITHSWTHMCHQATPPLPQMWTPLDLYQDLMFKRSFHSAAVICKDEKNEEKTAESKSVDPATKQNKETKSVAPEASSKPIEESKPKEGFMKRKMTALKLMWAEMRRVGVFRYMWDGLKSFILHYKNGFKLFWTDIKICLPLMGKYIRNGRSSLKRREYRQLTRTLADLVRMVPLIPMLIIPMAELFIPIYISMGMMPSVFLKRAEVDNRHRILLQKKLEYGALLTESLQNFKKKKTEGVSFQEFTDFMESVRDTEIMPSNEKIIKFSQLFENELTLDDLDTRQLQSLCKLLGIGFLGEIPSRRILRFQIAMKLRELEVDDKLIQKEGIDSLTIWELQNANRSRGMRAVGVPEDRLKLQLKQWLELHLNEKVPGTLLLLSRVMYLDENLSPAEQLKKTISALPETTVDKVKVASAEMTGEDVDKTTKLKVLGEEQAAIKSEKEQEDAEEALRLKKQREVEAQKKLEAEAAKLEEEARVLEAKVAAEQQYEAEKIEDVSVPKPDIAKPIEDVTPVKPDIAEPIEVKIPEEVIPEAAVIEEDDITSKDLGDIEKAIEEMARHQKDEFEDVKEDLEEYLENVEEIKALTLETSPEEMVQETKGAAVLRAKLDKYLSRLDNRISSLHEEKLKVQQIVEQQEVRLKYDLDGKRDELMESINAKKRNLIGINEVMLSLRRLQKVPDDMRMQKVLEVLDTDKDGKLDITDVLKVTELLGRENLKMSKSEVAAMMNLLQLEDEIKEEEKRQEKEMKGSKNNNSNNSASGEQGSEGKKGGEGGASGQEDKSTAPPPGEQEKKSASTAS